ncbi:peptide transporter [Pelagibacterium halotolerans]|uniref:peptide transporter n=1 Tax=Pelagibacterium halotolerans TaxID=531813 RepID=UPI00384D5BAD
MFRSFFPAPRLFFGSALAWLMLATVIWMTVGSTLQTYLSIDRFVILPTCEAVSPTEDLPQGQTAPDVAPPGEVQEDGIVAELLCLPEGTFFNAERVWLYQYVLIVALAFCAFWYVYKRNRWYWWSVVGTTTILIVIYFNVQVDAFVNDWQGAFFNTVQQALSQPGSVSPEEFYGGIFLLFIVLTPRILVLVLLAFFTSHYVFRWRKAMNAYYMGYWPAIRTTEGAAQRVQEDTMRFAQIMEDLGTAFFDALITLAVFVPILWTLSQHVADVPFLGDIPGSLVWVALVASAFGTVLLAAVGIKLPGLQFENQKVEAAYRKELVYGEDSADRATPPSVRELFANVQRNYFRIYWHYTYFNFARYGYLQLAGYIPLMTLSPAILAGTLTLGAYQQVQQAFGQVATSFQFLARAWTVVIELMSVRARLKRFESFIPQDEEPDENLVAAYMT